MKTATKTVHIRRVAKTPPENVARVIAKTQRSGDSDLKVAERVVTSLRAGYDPDATNEAWDALLWLLAIQDHRETKHKPTLRPGYHPKHHAKKPTAAARLR